jgi:transposase
MAMSRLEMQQILEILRLRFEGKHSYREIAASVNCGSSSVGECLRRFSCAGLSWPLPVGVDEVELQSRLYPPSADGSTVKQMPDWVSIQHELKKKSVTLMLLWLEYRQSHPHGHQYSQFCHHYKQWAKSVDVVFTNHHRAGEKVFVDYAGQTIPIWDAAKGTCQPAQIFIGVLGASSYAFVEASLSQKTSDWIASHKRMFAFFGGVAAIWVPDNLKSAVTTPCRYDPVINPAYYSMAKHYDASVIPARAKKPRDKAKAEAGVLHVERRILAKFRNRKFFSIDEVNQAISEELEFLNAEKFQKIAGSRQSLYEEIDRPALRPLPQNPFEISEYKLARVNINYHVELERHHYSVPYTYVQKEVMIRHTTTTVEISYKGQIISKHLRTYKPGYTTLDLHMPTKHQAHVKWTPERMVRWVGEAGANTTKVAEKILASRRHPEASFATILGMIRLGDKFGKHRLEGACLRALEHNTVSYRSLKNILSAKLDQSASSDDAQTQHSPISHENIRGPEYFN